MDRRALLTGLPACALGAIAGARGARAQVPAPTGAACHVRYAPARRARINHRYAIRFGNPNFLASAYHFSLMTPPSIPGFQEVEVASVSIRGVGEQKDELRDGKELVQQRPYRFQQFEVSGKYASMAQGVTYDVVYDVLAYASWLEPGPPGDGPAYAAATGDRKRMLESTRSLPHDDPAFEAFVQRNGWIRQDGEDPLLFLSRVCSDVLRGPYRFAETNGGLGGQHLLRVIQRTGCDCAGYATLLAGVCHRSGIRFDVMPGRRIADGGLMSIHHVLGLADLDGYGLFPVDLSKVVKGRSMQHFRAYGGDWQLMAYCRGEDVTIPDVFGGEHRIQFVQGPRVAVVGNGNAPRATVAEDSWTVRDLP